MNSLPAQRPIALTELVEDQQQQSARASAFDFRYIVAAVRANMVMIGAIIGAALAVALVVTLLQTRAILPVPRSRSTIRAVPF
jgi:hypothetical protein